MLSSLIRRVQLCLLRAAQTGFDGRQAFHHVIARWTKGKYFIDSRHDLFRSEFVLHQLRNNFLPSDQVHHGEVRNFNPRTPQ